MRWADGFGSHKPMFISHDTLKMSLSTDIPLLSRLCCRKGTESDWNQFYENYQDIIKQWCLQSGVRTSDLDDVFHDILIKLVRNLSSYDKSKGILFRSWLKTVVKNGLIDRLRFAANHPLPKILDGSWIGSLASEDVSPEFEQLVDQLTEKSSSAAKILNAVRGRVTEQTWDSFVRRELLGEDVSQIASNLDIKKASVYQSISRVRILIRRESEAYFRDAP